MSMRSSRRSWRSVPKTFALASLVAVAAIVAACGTAGSSAGPMIVRDPWIREPMAGMTAGYLVIENGTGKADVLTGVTIPAGGTVTLHRTTTDASGMSGMEPVDGIHVPAGGTVTLEPGGFHLMIDDLTASAGSMVELRLTFEQAGEIVVQAEVRAG
jgi:copper(I)-binding protein